MFRDGVSLRKTQLKIQEIHYYGISFNHKCSWAMNNHIVGAFTVFLGLIVAITGWYTKHKTKKKRKYSRQNIQVLILLFGTIKITNCPNILVV